MPWTSADAKKHSKLVKKPAHAEAWAKAANRALSKAKKEGVRDPEARAIKIANSLLRQMVKTSNDSFIPDASDAVFRADQEPPKTLLEGRGEIVSFEIDESTGILTADVIISQEAVLPYIVDGKIVHEYIPAAELSDQEFLDSIPGKPVTDGHPAEKLVTFDSLSQHSKGVLHGPFETFVDEDGVTKARGKETVWDPELVQDIADGKKRSVSIGRWAQLIREDGEWNGQSYQRRQAKLRCNHVAHTDSPRNEGCRILVDMMDPTDASVSTIREMPLAEQPQALKDLIQKVKGDPRGLRSVSYAVKDLRHLLNEAIKVIGTTDGEAKKTLTTALAQVKAWWPALHWKGDEEFTEDAWTAPTDLSAEDYAEVVPPAIAAWMADEESAEPVAIVRATPDSPLNLHALRALIGDGAHFDGVPDHVIRETREWAREQLTTYHMRGDSTMSGATKVEKLQLTLGDQVLEFPVDELDGLDLDEFRTTLGDFQKKIDEQATELGDLKDNGDPKPEKKEGEGDPKPEDDKSGEGDGDDEEEDEEEATPTDSLQKIVDAAQKEIERLKAQKDGKTDEIEALQKKLDEFKNGLPTAEAQAQAVMDEVETRTGLLQAIAFFSDDYSQSGKSTAEIKRDLLCLARPDSAEAIMEQNEAGEFVKSDAYVDARVEVVIDDITEQIGASVGNSTLKTRQDGKDGNSSIAKLRQGRQSMFKEPEVT